MRVEPEFIDPRIKSLILFASWIHHLQIFEKVDIWQKDTQEQAESLFHNNYARGLVYGEKATVHFIYKILFF